MTRVWDEFAASVFDVVSPQVLLLIGLVAAGVVGALWYWFPAWVPRRLPRLRLPRLRLPKWRLPKWRRKRKPKRAKHARTTAAEPAFAPTVVLPDGTLLADRLAAEGRFDEATHLLLQRSVGQIAAARPDLVEPATTARELAAMGALPDAARTAFGTIAGRVERSLFALRALGADDWQAARAAYADFALPQAWRA